MEYKEDLFLTITKEHDKYLEDLKGRLTALSKNLSKDIHERIDQLAFHVIEEIIEMRRTYPHKFWKQADENIDREAMLEEAADIFLMSRSMYKEVAEFCGITEEQFLEKILQKVRKNQRRLQDGY